MVHSAQPAACVFLQVVDWVFFRLAELIQSPEDVYSANQVKPTDADLLNSRVS